MAKPVTGTGSRTYWQVPGSTRTSESSSPGAIQYQEDRYSDGRIVLSKFDPAVGRWVQESVTYDPETADQYRKDNQAQREENQTDAENRRTAEQERHNRAQEDQAAATARRQDTRSAQDQQARNRQLDQQAQRDVDRIKIEQQNAQTSQGRLDLDRIRAAAEAKRDELNAAVAAGRLSQEERSLEWQKYKAQNIDAPIAQAHADAAKASAAASQQNAATNAAQLDFQREQSPFKNATDLLTFGQKAGEDAVANAKTLIPYMGGPNFGQHFADTLKGTSANFSGDDFKFTPPDFDAMAQQAAQRASQQFMRAVNYFKGGGGAMAAPGAPSPAVAPAPLPPSNVQTDNDFLNFLYTKNAGMPA